MERNLIAMIKILIHLPACHKAHGESGILVSKTGIGIRFDAKASGGLLSNKKPLISQRLSYTEG